MTQWIILFFLCGVELGVLIGFFIAAIILDKEDKNERR